MVLPVAIQSNLFILPLRTYYRQFNFFNKQTWMISTQQSPRRAYWNHFWSTDAQVS